MNRTTSHWQVLLWTAALFVFWSTPAVFALFYTYEGGTSPGFISLVAGMVSWLVVLVIWIAILLFTYRAKSKIIQLQYRKEFAAALFVSGIGILGTVMFVTEGLNMARAWIPHLILVLFVVNYSVMTIIGHRIYHVRLFDAR